MVDLSPDALLRTIANNPRVNEHGCNAITTRHGLEPHSFTPSDDAIKRLQLLCFFIDQNFYPKRSRRSSYGLKHIIEREKWRTENNRYVANGECMMAMIHCGYKPIWSTDDSNLNCDFNVDAEWEFKLGQKKAKEIWNKRSFHSGQWKQMVHKEEQFFIDTLYEMPVMCESGYNAMKKELRKKMVFCGACMPSTRWGDNHRSECKSKYADGVIPMDW